MNTWRLSLLPGLAALLLAVPLLWASPAHADEKTDALVEKAAFAMVELEFIEAATFLGDAAAHAHAQGLLFDERLVNNDVQRLVRRARLRGSMRATGRSVTAADMLATVISRLDPSRTRAYVSAHALSAQLLIDGTTTGAPELTGIAEEALRRYAGAPNTGAAAQMWADYARGLLAVEMHIADRGPLDAALRPLDAALDACEKEGWQEPAVCIGTELTSVYLALGRPTRATVTSKRVGRLLPAGADPAFITLWETLAASRLTDAPASVLAPVAHAKKVMEREVRVAWGRGSSRIKTREGKSKIGRAWAGLAMDAPFVVVEREKHDFNMRLTFGSKLGMTQPRRQGLWSFDAGGVRVGAHGQAVALDQIDLTGRLGGRGNGGPRPRWRSWIWLARGEIWSLSKNGRVTVSKRRGRTTGSGTAR